MKKIFVVTNPKKDKDFSVTLSAVNILKSNGAKVYLSENIADSIISGCIYTASAPEDIDLVIVIGGDGSFIDASSYAVERNVPILGINMGKVGYLSEVEPTEISDLKKIFTGEYKTAEKMLLSVKKFSDSDETVCERLAVNDIVISHNDHIGISDFVLYSEEGGIRYRADGIVFSTPQGSTAYSLSAGGPIVSHEAKAVIVTPIAPHSFFNRSLVFGKDEAINLKNTGEKPLNISVDGREFVKIAAGEKCEISASVQTMKVLTFKSNNMFSNLFGKIRIIEDII